MGVTKNNLAHINCWGQEQSLQAHSKAAAKYTAAVMSKIGLKNLGYLAGLLHDMGKGKAEFYEYLYRIYRKEKVVKGNINHTFAAVIFIYERYHKSDDSFELFTAELLACAVGSHHGLFDCVDLYSKKSGFVKRLEKDRKEICYEEAVEGFFENICSVEELDKLFKKAVEDMRNFKEHVKIRFYWAMLVRLLTAALIDADRFDTAEFMDGTIIKREKKTKKFWNDNLEFCEKELAKHKSDTPINEVRSYISDSCLEKARQEPGLYRLNVPTGGGKTLASLRYGLAHAGEYEKDRIIYVIPLLSVLEQNSKVILNHIKDKEELIEFHSNVLRVEEIQENLNHYELALDSFDAPFVITTLVQFLNILFDGSTSSIRRMQSLCNSVIIIDEIQSLPWKITAMFNKAVNFLVNCCHATVVLSSATQPGLEKLKFGLKFSYNPDLAVVHADLYSVFQRSQIVDCIRKNGYQASELGDFIDEILKECSSVLVICNTKKTAREIFRTVKKTYKNSRFFANSMCMEHRTDMLPYLMEDLENSRKHLPGKEKVVCVSTQVLETGVDVSFEAVIRVLAGLDSVIQGAGRCNRGLEYGHLCKTYLVNIPNENITYLEEIKQQQEAAARFLNAFQHYPEKYDCDLASEKSISEYYQCLYANLQKRGTLKYPVKTKTGSTERLYNLLLGVEAAEQPEKQILTQPFRTVGELFRVFDEEGVDVIVPYGKDGKNMVKELLSIEVQKDSGEEKKRLKLASRYIIRLFQYEIKALGQHVITHYIEHGEKHTCFYVLDERLYDPEIGFIGVEQMDSEQKGGRRYNE